MSLLRNLESKIEGLVEGVFSRTFKSHVQPVELARKLIKEMEEHKTVSVTKTYVPNEYTIYLSEADYDEIESYERALKDELATYLLEHARAEGLSLLTRPVITFESDDRLSLGEFGIQTRLVRPPSEDAAPEQGDMGQTMVYTSLHEKKPEFSQAETARPAERAVLSVAGKRYVVDEESVIGRSRSCDVVIADPNISRKHAELSYDGNHWFLTDLNSTNGTLLNGREISSSRLAPGDEVTFGTTQATFDVE